MKKLVAVVLALAMLLGVAGLAENAEALQVTPEPAQPFKDVPADGVIPNAADGIDSIPDAVRPEAGELFCTAQDLNTGDRDPCGNTVIDDAGDLPIQQPQQRDHGLRMSARTVNQNPFSHGPILIQKQPVVNFRCRQPAVDWLFS